MRIKCKWTYRFQIVLVSVKNTYTRCVREWENSGVQGRLCWGENIEHWTSTHGAKARAQRQEIATNALCLRNRKTVCAGRGAHEESWASEERRKGAQCPSWYRVSLIMPQLRLKVSTCLPGLRQTRCLWLHVHESLRPCEVPGQWLFYRNNNQMFF